MAFTATSAALALPVVLIGAALWPPALLSTVDDPDASLTVADGAASGPPLGTGPARAAAAAGPTRLQAMCWWVFRGRTDGRAPVYW